MAEARTFHIRENLLLYPVVTMNNEIVFDMCMIALYVGMYRVSKGQHKLCICRVLPDTGMYGM